MIERIKTSKETIVSMIDNVQVIRPHDQGLVKEYVKLHISRPNNRNDMVLIRVSEISAVRKALLDMQKELRKSKESSDD